MHSAMFCTAAAWLAAGASQGAETMRTAPFGNLDGRPVNLYTLANASGMEAAITNYGGIIVSLKVPDRDRKSVV